LRTIGANPPEQLAELRLCFVQLPHSGTRHAFRLSRRVK
jgi:hypothetical protein